MTATLDAIRADHHPRPLGYNSAAGEPLIECAAEVIESESAYRSNSAFPGSGTDRVDGGANNGDAPWFHVGSLSSGYGCAFMVLPNPTLIAQVSEEQERVDWTKRASWWQRAYDLWDGGIPDHHRQTVESFDAFCRATGMVPEQIAWWRRSYDPMVSWDERP